jgi:hypothetical protein
LQGTHVEAGVGGKPRFLSEPEKQYLGVPEDRPDRHGDRDGEPQALTKGAADIARRVPVAAEFSGDHRRGGRDDADTEEKEGEKQIGAERRGGERIGAETADQDDVGRRHRRLGDVGQNDRPGERQRRADLRAPRAAKRSRWNSDVGHGRASSGPIPTFASRRG